METAFRSPPAADGTDGPPRPESAPRRRLLTATMVLAAVLFVLLTIGTSLIGRTAFYGGGLILNNPPWLAERFDPIDTNNIYVGDTVDATIPTRTEMMERIRGGDWPGWTSLQGPGSELASVPNVGLLAPTAVAWWLLPTELAPGWEKLTVLVVAAAGTALFLRRLRLSRHAAWLGGMVYAGSGFMIAWTNWPQAGVAAMLPWLFWAVERSIQLRTVRSVVPVALSVAALVLGGFPAVTGWGLYAAGFYALVRLVVPPAGGRVDWRAAPAQAGRLIAGLVLGVCVAAAQLSVFLFQFLDLDLAYRANGFGATVPLRMALTSVFPHTWGINGGIFYSRTNPIEANAYLGAAAAVLCVLAVVSRRPRETPRGVRTFLVALAAFCAFLVYVQAPFTDWIGSLPIFSGNPIMRLVSILLLACAFLAGFGAEAVLRPVEGARRLRSRLLASVVIAGFGISLVALAVFVHSEVAPWLDTPDMPGVPVYRWLAVALAGAGAVTAIGLLLQWRPRAAAALFAVVPLIVAAQGLVAARPAWEQVDADRFYPETDMHEYLEEHLGHDRLVTTGSTMLVGTSAYYGLRAATGHVFFPQPYSELIDRIAPNGRMSPTYWMLPAGLDLDLWHSPGLDRLSARYLVADSGTGIPGALAPLVTGDRDAPLPVAPVTVALPPGPLRGLNLDLVSGPAEEWTGGYVVAELLDPAGVTVAATRRLVRYPHAAGPLPVPLAAEDAGDRPLTLRLRWEGDSPAPVLRTGAAGVPALTLVRPADDGLRLASDDDGVVWERTSALPRIRWASSAVVVDNPALRADTVAYDDIAPDAVVLSGPGEDVDGLPAALEITEDSGDTVSVEVDAEGAGYLVLAESVQADWSVTVDGEDAPIVAADHAYGGVHVPAGEHRVEFRYTPRGQPGGTVVSLAALAVLAVLALPPRVWSRIRRRRAG